MATTLSPLQTASAFNMRSKHQQACCSHHKPTLPPNSPRLAGTWQTGATAAGHAGSQTGPKPQPHLPRPRDDHISKLARWRHVLVKRGLDELGVLPNYARHVAPPHRHVPLDPGGEQESTDSTGRHKAGRAVITEAVCHAQGRAATTWPTQHSCLLPGASKCRTCAPAARRHLCPHTPARQGGCGEEKSSVTEKQAHAKPPKDSHCRSPKRQALPPPSLWTTHNSHPTVPPNHVPDKAN